MVPAYFMYVVARFMESFCMNIYADNPFYTDTRYNDKSHYNDIMTVTKPSLKR